MDVSKLSKAQLEALVQEMAARAEAAEAAAKAREATLSVKFSGETGVIVLYGLGRHPVALYSTQWLRLLEEGDTLLREFIAKYSTVCRSIEQAKGDKTKRQAIMRKAAQDGAPVKFPADKTA